MKKFSDLEFKSATWNNGVVGQIDFENGWGVSVVKHDFSYGGKQGLYELAVIKGDEIHYENPVANGDVVGYLKPEDVTRLMEQIQNYK